MRNGLHSADVAEIREAVTDELKKVQKDKFSTDFQKLNDGAKTCIQGVPGGMCQISGGCSLC